MARKLNETADKSGPLQGAGTRTRGYQLSLSMVWYMLSWILASLCLEKSVFVPVGVYTCPAERLGLKKRRLRRKNYSFGVHAVHEIIFLVLDPTFLVKSVFKKVVTLGSDKSDRRQRTQEPLFSIFPNYINPEFTLLETPSILSGFSAFPCSTKSIILAAF